jgi:hypothetical protein
VFRALARAGRAAAVSTDASGGNPLATKRVMARVPRPTVIALTLSLAVVPVATGGPSPRALLETMALRDEATPAIELGLTKPVAPAVHRLEHPPRLYVDLPGTTLGAKVARSLEGRGTVKRVRVGQFDAATARVVIELAAPARIDVEPAGTGLRLVVAGTSAPTPPVTKPTSPHASRPAAVVAPAAPVPASEPVAAASPPPDVPRLLVVRTDAPLVAAPKPAERAVPTTLQERIARRAAAEDWPGVVALYAPDMRTVREDADSATRAAVVDALRELGLVHAARKLLGPATPGEAPALRVARAEVALRAGQPEEAAALVAGLDEAAIDPVLAPKLRRVHVRLALARGDLEAAAAGIGNRATPDLRAELADVAIRTGRAAADQRSCRRAVAAFRTALDADGGRTARAAAGAGLVRAALACADTEATMNGLGVLAESPHPLLRRAATAIAKTQVEEKRPASSVGRGG